MGDSVQLGCRELIKKFSFPNSQYLMSFQSLPPSLIDEFRVEQLFNDTATTEIYTLSLHDALPICAGTSSSGCGASTRTRFI